MYTSHVLYQNHLISKDTVNRPDVRTWFGYIYYEKNPESSRYRCRLCYQYGSELYKVAQQIPNIATKDGDLNNSYKKNNEKIRKHSTSVMHKEVIKLKKRKLEILPTIIREQCKKEKE